MCLLVWFELYLLQCVSYGNTTQRNGATVWQRKTAVTAYLKSKQLLLFSLGETVLHVQRQTAVTAFCQ